MFGFDPATVSLGNFLLKCTFVLKSLCFVVTRGFSAGGLLITVAVDKFNISIKRAAIRSEGESWT